MTIRVVLWEDKYSIMDQQQSQLELIKSLHKFLHIWHNITAHLSMNSIIDTKIYKCKFY